LGAAIAGFLVDFSYDYLKNMGYNNFLINGSGEIRVSGNKYGKNWIIGIQSPYSNAIIDIVSLPDSFSISTSGSYERFFIYDNLKYHHILNPFTGKPDSRLDSVSIVTKDNCLAADILSTAIFAMGIENSIKFCLENNIEYYIVYKINGETFKRFSSFFNNAINK
ncbi:MAG: FAD:protein FMN transferase, partial [Exilispira sp.]